MAHPYAKHHQDKVSRQRVKHLLKGYDSGGRTGSYPLDQEGVEGARVPKGGTATAGPIERLGVKTYRREVGRDMTSGKFGKYPYDRAE